MSAAKKKTPSSPKWLLGSGRPVLIVAVSAAIIGGGVFWAWKRLGPRIVNSPEYQAGVEQIEINPPPPWIQSDVRAAAFHQPTLDGPLSLLDDTLVERIRSAFRELPWVANVRSVVKGHPIRVELEYRRPVCMVEVPGEPRRVLPVDVEAVLLPPEDFTPMEAMRYPHLGGVDVRPIGPAGRRWTDPRVIGGAEIAAALADVWQRLKLDRIDAVANAVAGAAVRARPAEPLFVLSTRAGTRITWGYAPGAARFGRAAGRRKARLPAPILRRPRYARWSPRSGATAGCANARQYRPPPVNVPIARRSDRVFAPICGRVRTTRR